MPIVGVGDQTCKVSWSEYHLAIMPKGTLVEFDKKPCFLNKAQRGRGIFKGSMFYDGISGRVEFEVDDTGKRQTVHLFPDSGDRVRRIKR